MAERQVSIYPMPKPFLVMATQNPIENGASPLPEAQRDRFLFKVLVDYPSVEGGRDRVPDGTASRRRPRRSSIPRR